MARRHGVVLMGEKHSHYFMRMITDIYFRNRGIFPAAAQSSRAINQNGSLAAPCSGTFAIAAAAYCLAPLAARTA